MDLGRIYHDNLMSAEKFLDSFNRNFKENLLELLNKLLGEKLHKFLFLIFDIYRNVVFTIGCLFLFSGYVLKIIIYFYSSAWDFFIVFHSYFVSNGYFLDWVKEKKIIIVEGGLGSKKEIFLRHIHRKILKHGEKSRFLLSSFTKKKVVDIFHQNESSFEDLLIDYKKDYKDIVYEVGGNITLNKSQNESNINLVRQIAKEIYLSEDSTIFLSSFSKGKFFEEVKNFADCIIFCRDTRRAFFDNFVILSFEVKKSPSCDSSSLSKKNFVLKKSEYKKFENEIEKNSLLKALI